MLIFKRLFQLNVCTVNKEFALYYLGLDCTGCMNLHCTRIYYNAYKYPNGRGYLRFNWRHFDKSKPYWEGQGIFNYSLFTNVQHRPCLPIHY